MTIEELRQNCEVKTFADVEDLGKRVFYTLTDMSEGKPISVSDAAQPTKLYFALHRQAMFISFLCENLESKGIVSKAEIENMLIDSVNGPGTSAVLQ